MERRFKKKNPGSAPSSFAHVLYFQEVSSISTQYFLCNPGDTHTSKETNGHRWQTEPPLWSWKFKLIYVNNAKSTEHSVNFLILIFSKAMWNKAYTIKCSPVAYILLSPYLVLFQRTLRAVLDWGDDGGGGWGVGAQCTSLPSTLSQKPV